jgi:hypothetical protein
MLSRLAVTTARPFSSSPAHLPALDVSARFAPLVRAALSSGALPTDVATFSQLADVVNVFGGRSLRRARGDGSEGRGAVVGSSEDAAVLRAAVSRAELLLAHAPPGAPPLPLVGLVEKVVMLRVPAPRLLEAALPRMVAALSAPGGGAGGAPPLPLDGAARCARLLLYAARWGAPGGGGGGAGEDPLRGTAPRLGELLAAAVAEGGAALPRGGGGGGGGPAARARARRALAAPLLSAAWALCVGMALPRAVAPVAGAVALLDDLHRGCKRAELPAVPHGGRLSAVLAGLRACGGGGGGSGVGATPPPLGPLPGVPPALSARLKRPLCRALWGKVEQWRALSAANLRPSALQREVAGSLSALCASAGLPAPEEEAMVEGFSVDVALRPPWEGEVWGGARGGVRGGRVAVEVDGPSHDGGCGGDDGAPLPPPDGEGAHGIAAVTGFKEWVVARAGYEVVRVPWREWRACGGDAREQRRYLLGRLRGTALAPLLEAAHEGRAHP